MKLFAVILVFSPLLVSAWPWSNAVDNNKQQSTDPNWRFGTNGNWHTMSVPPSASNPSLFAPSGQMAMAGYDKNTPAVQTAIQAPPLSTNSTVVPATPSALPIYTENVGKATPTTPVTTEGYGPFGNILRIIATIVRSDDSNSSSTSTTTTTTTTPAPETSSTTTVAPNDSTTTPTGTTTPSATQIVVPPASAVITPPALTSMAQTQSTATPTVTPWNTTGSAPATPAPGPSPITPAGEVTTTTPAPKPAPVPASATAFGPYTSIIIALALLVVGTFMC